ncbi:hypothetical protein ACQ4PT_002920 [Festuca glaucescens]
MSFRGMLREMKGEVGAISRRGLLRSRTPSVRLVAAVAPEEATRQGCCWAELPPELLREVLARVEEAEPRWPRRRDVVACAGVCRTWRGVVKEIVRVPEASGKLTFPISVKQVAAPSHSESLSVSLIGITVMLLILQSFMIA